MKTRATPGIPFGLRVEGNQILADALDAYQRVESVLSRLKSLEERAYEQAEEYEDEWSEATRIGDLYILMLLAAGNIERHTGCAAIEDASQFPLSRFDISPEVRGHIVTASGGT